MEIFTHRAMGYVFVALVLLLTLLAWKKVRHNHFRQALIVVLLLGLILRTYPALDFRLHDWDEQYHALVAKHLADNPLKPTLFQNPVLNNNSQNWVGGHVWLEKPPIALWGMAFSIKLFGTSTLAVRLPSLIYGVLAILLTYGIGSRLFDKRTGIFAAYLHAINGALIELGCGRISSDHVETALIFFVQLAVFLAIFFYRHKRNYSGTVLIAFVTGLAFLSKWYPAGIIIPLWLLCFLLPGKTSFRELFLHSSLFLISFAAVVLPWVVFIHYTYPVETQVVLGKYLNAYAATVEDHNAQWYYYLHEVMILFGELCYVVLLFSIYQIFKHRQHKEILILLVWISIPILIFSLGETKRFTYLLITAPAFFILTSHFWFYLLDRIKTFKMRWVAYLALTAFVLLPLRFMLERTKPFEAILKSDYPFYQKITQYQKILDQNDVVFGSSDNIRLMFFTSVAAAYHNFPEVSQVEALKDQGYDVYSMDGLELVKQ